jgi:hypothetical protein
LAAEADIESGRRRRREATDAVGAKAAAAAAPEAMRTAEGLGMAVRRGWGGRAV